ncbi:hypothetical protein HK100_002629 [Physocladia obscura]|uniref:Peptide hydrolase n=1 Tax=Physocladia obscura TaxID=109957 RepID=A0AAD5SW36_9FUNG|nr:hypothetical protein HK100_002629 [Physocladia obscura]
MFTVTLMLIAFALTSVAAASNHHKLKIKLNNANANDINRNGYVGINSSFYASRDKQTNIYAGLRRVIIGQPATEINNAEETLMETNWLTTEQILGLLRTRTPFMDVTDSPNIASHHFSIEQQHSVPIISSTTLVNINSNASIPLMRPWLKSLTSIHNRHHHSPEGYRASRFIYNACKSVIADLNSNNDRSWLRDRFNVTVSRVHHSGYLQYSVIARVQFLNRRQRDGGVVIVSANLDSFNIYNPLSARSPGANANASGSTTLFETLRLYLLAMASSKSFSSSTTTFTTSAIEFHWYAASQIGLVGSQQVAAHYKRNGVLVLGVLHLARTGWDRCLLESGIVAIASDNRQKSLNELTQFFKNIVSREFSVVDRVCRFACSDHWSWIMMGYPAVFAFEPNQKSEYPFLYQITDDDQTVSFDRMAKFCKIAIAFIVGLIYLDILVFAILRKTNAIHKDDQFDKFPEIITSPVDLEHEKIMAGLDDELNFDN